MISIYISEVKNYFESFLPVGLRLHCSGQTSPGGPMAQQEKSW
jgi:hypothetical protein